RRFPSPLHASVARISALSEMRIPARNGQHQRVLGSLPRDLSLTLFVDLHVTIPTRASAPTQPPTRTARCTRHGPDAELPAASPASSRHLPHEPAKFVLS